MPMKITLIDEEAIRMEATPRMMSIEAASEEQIYSPYQMLGSSLACCTWYLRESRSNKSGIPSRDLAIEVRWTCTDNPHRVGSMSLLILWPSLPKERLKAAERAALQCLVRHTLSIPPHTRIESK